MNAVITTPSIFGLKLALINDNAVKVTFDTALGKLDIKGPDPQATLDLLRELNGFQVKHGQLLQIELAAGDKVELLVQRNGTLKILAPQVTLEVIATDTFGDSRIATASPVFAPDVTAADALGVSSIAETSSISEAVEASALQPAPTSWIVFSETITRLIAYREIRIETTDGQAELIVPVDFLSEEVTGQIVELELKNLDPVTVPVPEKSVQFIRAVEVNVLVQG